MGSAVQRGRPLRAVINGTLTNAPADLYDGFIRREIALADTAFHQAKLIANILCKYRLGIGDGWIAQRMEIMLQNGELEAVTQPDPDSFSYRRILKKVSL